MSPTEHDARRLDLKLVYYGPVLGGKTTTLAALHRILDPDGACEPISIRTADDRTLLFDLLAVDLGEVADCWVSIKLYTVSGQVPHDTTRRVVLSEADALIFVADSSPSRREQDVWSLQNLRMNMRVAGLDPEALPVVFQFNKQDLPDAALPPQVAAWLGVDPERGFATAALSGSGVFEPFAAACLAAARRAEGGGEELERSLARALRPYAARSGEGRHRAAGLAGEAIVLGGEDMLECAVRASLALAERLATRPAPAEVLARRK